MFRGQIPEGKRIAVLGGGLIGCETAEYLAANFGKEVEIFELRDDIAVDLVKSRRIFMLKRMMTVQTEPAGALIWKRHLLLYCT